MTKNRAPGSSRAVTFYEITTTHCRRGFPALCGLSKWMSGASRRDLLLRPHYRIGVQGHYSIIRSPPSNPPQTFRRWGGSRRDYGFSRCSATGECHAARTGGAARQASELRVGIRAGPAPGRCDRVGCHIACARRQPARPLYRDRPASARWCGNMRVGIVIRISGYIRLRIHFVYVLLDHDDLLREALLQRIKKFFGVRTDGEVRHQILNGSRG